MNLETGGGDGDLVVELVHENDEEGDIQEEATGDDGRVIEG